MKIRLLQPEDKSQRGLFFNHGNEGIELQRVFGLREAR